MKQIFSFAAALLIAATSNAQVNNEAISATLQNGETSSIYYGTDALKTALSNAEDGSIITLSSGSFSVPSNIEKSVKIYGAGYEDDTLTGIPRTFLNGDIIMKGVDGVHVDNFYIEGVYINGNISIRKADNDSLIQGTKIVKCRMTGVVFYENSNQTVIRQCRIDGPIEGYEYTKPLATNLMVQNCLFSYIINFDTQSTIIVNHCIASNYYWQYYGPYVYKNSIISGSNSYAIQSGATLINCVGGEGGFNSTNILINCYHSFQWNTLFADGQNNLNYYLTDTQIPRTWQLADPETFKGDDNTPVGVTGGDFPWEKIPSTPRIIRSQIDSKTVNGKLHINIKAEARPVTE